MIGLNEFKKITGSDALGAVSGSTCVLVGVLFLVLLTAASGSLFAQHERPPHGYSEPRSFAPLESIPQLELPAIDREALLVEDEINAKGEPGPLRFAVPVDLSMDPEKDGWWELTEDGGSLWRLRVVSPGATDLNFGFDRFILPTGAALWVYSESERYFRGPYTNEVNYADNQLWTPVIPGEAGVIELYLPEKPEAAPEVHLTRVGCGYRDWFGRLGGDKAGACNIDVICPEGDGWRDQIQSVAVYQKGSTWTCSGAMINNTAQDLKPYFLSANHCSVNSSNAASIVAYFNFYSPTCGQHGGGSLSQATTGGAIFRASYAASDFLLFEFVNPPSSAWNVYWSGWDRSSGDSSSAVVIHHPNCDEKSISFEDQATTTTTYYQTSSPGDGSHIRVADYDVRPSGEGTTEPGSSGSPLYSPGKRIVGQLHGGDAACGNNSADWYGRVSVSWPGGGSNSTRLSTWLDPGSTGATTLDGTWACITPGTPASPQATTPSNNLVRLTWTAGNPAGATYTVLRATEACGSGTPVQIASGITGTTWDDSTVSGSVTYSYQVQAIDTTGGCSSAKSTCVQATPTGICTAAPTFGGATSVSNGAVATCTLTVQWAAGTALCSGPVSYSIYRSTSSSFTPGAANRIATGVSGTTYTDTAGLMNGTNYYYIVRARDNSNDSEDTNTATRSAKPTGTITTTTITETFETSPGGFDNAGWSHAILSGTNDWAWSAVQSQTPTHSWFSQSQSSVSSRVLTTPSFGVIDTTTMSFYHHYSFEGSVSSCYDAGRLEYSTDGGTNWFIVPGTAFTAGGYNGTVNSGYSNPLAGSAAWCSGTIGAMTQATVDLSFLAGQSNVMLRWREADDSSSVGTGWYVDSVIITNAGNASSCSAGTVPTPREVSPSGTMLATAGTGTTVNLSYTPACGAVTNTVYLGTASAPMTGVAWTQAFCDKVNTGSASFDPGTPAAGSFAYFVIVANRGTVEGSYGHGTSGERTDASGLSCDYTRDFGGVCP